MDYYNEIDPKAAAWLRELIKQGLIPDGEVDERSIADVGGWEIGDFTQCHFFAGIGGWSYALQLAGWDSESPVWTGSCPCQPFSAAGKGKGTDDSRHLWPEFYRLISECKPPTVFGEQVASPAGLQWFDLVSTDLEGAGYTVGAADLCAAGVGTPHIRQRLWFVADSGIKRRQQERRSALGDEATNGRAGRNGCESNSDNEPAGHGENSSMAHADRSRLGTGRAGETGDGRDTAREQPTGLCDARVGDTIDTECRRFSGHPRIEGSSRLDDHGSNPWLDFGACECRDGKLRPVEPGTFPLAHGVPARVGRLRGYGNAIVPQVAAEFIQAYCEARELVRG